MTESCSVNEARLSFQPPDQPDAPNDPRSPFVHRFKTEQHYVYDVNTCRIFCVSPVVWDIIGDAGVLDEPQLLARHSELHGPMAIAAGIKEIAAAQAKGFFLAYYPERIVAYHEPDLRQRLDSARGQLILNLTESCNFRCSYCLFGGQYPNRRKHSSRRMTWQTAQAAIDDFMPHSRLSERRFVTFYGGEPLLENALLRKCVRHAKGQHPDLPVRFCLTTNGSLLAGDLAAFLAAEEFLITVSLDGPETVHDRHRRNQAGEPTFTQVMDNVQRFLEAHPGYRTNGQLRFNAVASRQTDLRQLQEFFGTHELFTDSMELGFTSQNPVLGRSAGASADDPLAESFSFLYERFIGDLKSGRFGEAYGSRESSLATAAFEAPLVHFHKRKYLSPHLPESMIAPSGCLPGMRRVFVSVDGDYYPCERVVESPNNLIGNVSQGVNAEKVMALLDRWNRANLQTCGHCWCLPTCGVGCLASAWNDGTMDPSVKARACARHRQEIHRLLVEYCGILEENPRAFDFAAQIHVS